MMGWMVIYLDGRSMRVLALVALFLGYYKQVSKTSQLIKHTANAPCILCGCAGRKLTMPAKTAPVRCP